MIHIAASAYPAGNFNIPIGESKCMVEIFEGILNTLLSLVSDSISYGAFKKII